MIVKGKSRNNPGQLAEYLLREEENEQVRVLSNDYGQDTSLHDALCDMQELSSITKGVKGLYHAQISPAQVYQMKDGQWSEAMDILERDLGLDGQQRVAVIHTKGGHDHLHVVWCRTDVEQGKMISDGKNYHAHEKASAEMEQRFGHERVPGVHHKRDPEQKRPQRGFDFAQWQQSQRSKVDPRQRQQNITALYKSADTGAAFQNALEESGYFLARGDRRALVVIDMAGEIYALNRQISGHKAKEIKAKLLDIDPQGLPNTHQGKQLMETRARAQFERLREQKAQQEASSQKNEESTQLKKLRVQSAAARSKSVQALQQRMKTFDRQTGRRRQSLIERHQWEQQTMLKPLEQEQQQLLANQKKRGFITKRLARWMGVEKKEKTRLQTLKKQRQGFENKQQSEKTVFERRQEQERQTLSESLKHDRIEQERVLQTKFKDAMLARRPDSGHEKQRSETANQNSDQSRSRSRDRSSGRSLDL